MRTHLSVLILILALGGCSPSSPSGLGATPKLTASDLEVLPVQLSLGRVRGMALGSGALWLLNSEPPFLARVPLEQGEVVSFARRGEGPGELLDPRVLLSGSAGSGSRPHVWDYGSGRISTFDSSGVFLASAPLDEGVGVSVRWDLNEVTFADPLRVRSDGAGFLVVHVPHRVDRPSDLLAGSLQRTDLTLAPGPSLVRFADHTRESGDATKVWGPLPLWDACEGASVLWSPDSSRVVWVDSKGLPIRSVPVPIASIPIEIVDVERYLRRMARLELGPKFESAGLDFSRQARARRENFAETRPLATDVRCEGPAVAWLRLFDTEVDAVGRSQRWLRTSVHLGLSTTPYLRHYPRNKNPPSLTRGALRNTFPQEFTPGVFTPEEVLGTIRDSVGLHRIARWRPPWSTAKNPPQPPPEDR